MGGERKADDISNLYPLQYQPNYKVPIVQTAEGRACKTTQMLSVLVVLIMLYSLS